MKSLQRDIVSKNYEIRKKAIKSANLSSELVDIALKDKDPRIVRMACQHPNLRFESATRLIRRVLKQKALDQFDASYLYYALENSVVTKEFMLSIVNYIPEHYKFCGSCMVRNPNCDSKLLLRMMQSSLIDTRAAAASSLKLGGKGAKIAAADSRAEVRAGLAKNEKWILHYGKQLVFDASRVVRLQVLGNKKTDSYVLNNLLADRDEDIRQGAILRLKARLAGWRD